VKPLLKSSIPSGEPAGDPDPSTLLKAKPVEPVSSVETVIFYPCMYPPANYHIDIGFRQRDGDGSCLCLRIAMQTVILDI